MAGTLIQLMPERMMGCSMPNSSVMRVFTIGLLYSPSTLILHLETLVKFGIRIPEARTGDFFGVPCPRNGALAGKTV
jgi:hypothetical protein